MKNDDYGYFGKGTEGYIHYKKTFDRLHAGNKPTPKPRTPESIIDERQRDIEYKRKILKVLVPIAAILTVIALVIGIPLIILTGDEELICLLVKVGICWAFYGVLCLIG